MDIRNDKLTQRIRGIMASYLKTDEINNLPDAIMDDYEAELNYKGAAGRAHEKNGDTLILILHHVLKDWNISTLTRYKLISDAINAYNELAAEADPHRSCATCARADGEKMCYEPSSDMSCANWASNSHSVDGGAQ